MSQVKNLRAMFENKGDSSPPDRGRSPGISSPRRHVEGLSSSSSPRRLSKVRTNFVAIEKDGRMGLRRDQSGEPSLSRGRLSMDTADAETNTDFVGRINTESLEDDAKMSHKHPITGCNQEPIRDNLGDNMAGNPGDTARSASKTGPEPEPSHNAVSLDREKEEVADSSQIKTFKSSPTSSRHGRGKKHQTPSTAMKLATRGPKVATKITLDARSQPTGPTRGSVFSKAPLDMPKKSARETRPPARVRPPPLGLSCKIQPPKVKSQNDTGFAKPKPKSPTKPVELPSSLTAPTASSESKASGSSLTQHRLGASWASPIASSQTSNRGDLILASSVGTINRQEHASSKSRPSLGPPPNKPSQGAATNKKQSNIDEGFLARMMRPTQSSSSKLADKSPITPPKKTAQRLGRAEHPKASDQVTNRSLSSRNSHTKKTLKNKSAEAKPTSQFAAVGEANVQETRKSEDTHDKPGLRQEISLSGADVNQSASEVTPERLSVKIELSNIPAEEPTENDSLEIPKTLHVEKGVEIFNTNSALNGEICQTRVGETGGGVLEPPNKSIFAPTALAPGGTKEPAETVTVQERNFGEEPLGTNEVTSAGISELGQEQDAPIDNSATRKLPIVEGPTAATLCPPDAPLDTRNPGGAGDADVEVVKVSIFRPQTPGTQHIDEDTLPKVSAGSRDSPLSRPKLAVIASPDCLVENDLEEITLVEEEKLVGYGTITEEQLSSDVVRSLTSETEMESIESGNS
ncbi:hypothetical protein QQS21_003183 [Conoideocrella luteorostrata]|uniref:Uncharacterized protein n=1 Tax=Conoideocrella luteorostrata TaxID=1105319 RepID=A0AAJ0G0R8_9HYPO|nr:hypothetical protein QQS21_003183 [Conoideocrella luteorostrata]